MISPFPPRCRAVFCILASQCGIEEYVQSFKCGQVIFPIATNITHPGREIRHGDQFLPHPREIRKVFAFQMPYLTLLTGCNLRSFCRFLRMEMLTLVHLCSQNIFHDSHTRACTKTSSTGVEHRPGIRQTAHTARGFDTQLRSHHCPHQTDIFYCGPCLVETR